MVRIPRNRYVIRALLLLALNACSMSYITPVPMMRSSLELLVPPKLVVLPPTFSAADTETPNLPKDPEQVITFLTKLVNEGADRNQLAELINYWEEQWPTTLPERDYVSGMIAGQADLNGDNQSELLVMLPGAQVVVFWRNADSSYQPSIYQLHDLLGRIWKIADINNDASMEIILQSSSCNPNDCSLTINILQWTANQFHNVLIGSSEDGDELPGVSAPAASAVWRDVNADGLEDLVLTSDPENSGGVGVQRKFTEIYAWDGHMYQLIERDYDPIASQHPYFKLLDGNQAFRNGDYYQAIRLYQESIATPYPGNETLGDAGLTDMESIIVAAARFQLMVAYLTIGDINQARATYHTTQHDDDNYATWAETFWSVYQTHNAIVDGCQAAITAAQDSYLPGAGYTVTSVGALLCPTKQPETP